MLPVRGSCVYARDALRSIRGFASVPARVPSLDEARGRDPERPAPLCPTSS